MGKMQKSENIKVPEIHTSRGFLGCFKGSSKPKYEGPERVWTEYYDLTPLTITLPIEKPKSVEIKCSKCQKKFSIVIKTAEQVAASASSDKKFFFWCPLVLGVLSLLVAVVGIIRNRIMATNDLIFIIVGFVLTVIALTCRKRIFEYSKKKAERIVRAGEIELKDAIFGFKFLDKNHKLYDKFRQEL